MSASNLLLTSKKVYKCGLLYIADCMASNGQEWLLVIVLAVALIAVIVIAMYFYLSYSSISSGLSKLDAQLSNASNQTNYYKKQIPPNESFEKYYNLSIDVNTSKGLTYSSYLLNATYYNCTLNRIVNGTFEYYYTSGYGQTENFHNVSFTVPRYGYLIINMLVSKSKGGSASSEQVGVTREAYNYTLGTYVYYPPCAYKAYYVANPYYNQTYFSGNYTLMYVYEKNVTNILDYNSTSAYLYPYGTEIASVQSGQTELVPVLSGRVTLEIQDLGSGTEQINVSTKYVSN
jgi:hypothetical protein